MISARPVIWLAALAVIGAARVELHAPLPHSAGLDLDPHDVPIGRNHGREIESKPLPVRKKDRYVSPRKRREDRGFRSISSVNRLHGAKVHTAPDEHTFVPPER